jgi:hypothetical protein
MWFTALLGIIPGIFTTITGVTNAITNEKINLANAQNSSDKIASDERIAQLTAQRDVMIAESSTSKLNGIIRAIIGGSAAFVLAKLLVYDKALGQWTGGHTDALDPNLWYVVTATIGFYFLYEGAVNATRIIKS